MAEGRARTIRPSAMEEILELRAEAARLRAGFQEFVDAVGPFLRSIDHSGGALYQSVGAAREVLDQP